jgi:hypothetical protein
MLDLVLAVLRVSSQAPEPRQACHSEPSLMRPPHPAHRPEKQKYRAWHPPLRRRWPAHNPGKTCPALFRGVARASLPKRKWADQIVRHHAQPPAVPHQATAAEPKVLAVPKCPLAHHAQRSAVGRRTTGNQCETGRPEIVFVFLGFLHPNRSWPRKNLTICSPGARKPVGGKSQPTLRALRCNECSASHLPIPINQLCFRIFT